MSGACIDAAVAFGVVRRWCSVVAVAFGVVRRWCSVVAVAFGGGVRCGWAVAAVAIWNTELITFR